MCIILLYLLLYVKEVNMTTEKLMEHLSFNRTIWYISKEENISSVTIRKRMKRLGIKTPKGFYYTGKLIGRPSGIPMSDKQKSLYRVMFKGENNPFFGKKHSDKTRDEMSKNHADFTGDNNPFKNSLNTPEKRIEHSNRCKALWAARDGEWHRKHSEVLSAAVAKQQQANPNMHKGYDCGWIETKKGGKVWCRSSWEKKVCSHLDFISEVISFKLEPFCIKYIDKSGNTRHSRIDFLALTKGKTIMIEVKPKPLHDLSSAKIDGYRMFCKENGFVFLLAGKEEVDTVESFGELIRKGIYESGNVAV